MIYIIIGSILLIFMLFLLIIHFYNKFIYIDIKIKEAENNIDMLEEKEYILLTRAINIIDSDDLPNELTKILKIKTNDTDHFELNEILKKAYSSLLSMLDIDETEDLLEIMNNLFDNNEDMEAAIKYYNKHVTIYNKYIKSFPSNLIRLLFRYHEKEFYNDQQEANLAILKEVK
ncbi:MAG: LemA family protein [Bacilli bacterium]